MIEIYRVEHKDTGVGVFQTPDEYNQNLANIASTKLHTLKSPGDDGLGLANIPWTFVFGCPDIVSMKKWILLGGNIHENDSIVKTLDEKGFKLFHYLIDDEQYIRKSWSGIQLAFDKKYAVEEGVWDYYPLTDLMREAPTVFCL